MSGARGSRVVYRRTGVAIAWAVVALGLLALAAALTPDAARDGWRSALVPWAVTVPLAVLAVLVGALPRLVLTETSVEAHNMLFIDVVPLSAVREVGFGRLGLMLRTVDGRRVPVVAFARSRLVELLTGDAATKRMVAEVNRRVGASVARDEPPGAVTRRLNRPVLAALLVTGALAAAVLLTAL